MAGSQVCLGADGGAGGGSDAYRAYRGEGVHTVVLSLSELVPDANGEVVLFNDSGYRRLVLEAAARPVARGPARPHVTVAGVDVTGHECIVFDSGVTFYYPPGLEVVLAGESG